MRITCVGAGPAGLYTAIALRRLHPEHEVTVVERRPRGVTHGWGVVFWDDLLDELHRVDAPSARAIRAAAVVWDGQGVRVGDRAPIFLGGSGYAIGRHHLLSVLAERALLLGADVRFSTAADPELLAGADLVVAADGAGSRLRAGNEHLLGTTVEAGRHRYVWLGTSALFTTFTFGFVDTGSGWIWCHAYRFNERTSTFIVECPPATWTALGLDDADTETCLRTLESVFAHLLQGAPLDAGDPATGPAPWTPFRSVTNRRWHAGNVVLVGDAAHTTHFAIGSGTRLAMLDAIALAHYVGRIDGAAELPGALAAYGAERRAGLAPLQDEAARSTAWFEQAVETLGRTDDLHLGWSLWQRRGGAPSWRWYLHVASQHPPVRRLRTSAGAVRRSVRARRREAR